MFAAALLLSACGGGGGGGSGSQSASYTFVEPSQGQSQTYAYTLTNFDDTSAGYNYTSVIDQVNADGSYLMTWVPHQSSYTLDGTKFGLSTETDTYDNKGQYIEYADGASAINSDFYCYYSYANGGQPASLSPGQSWVNTVSYHCTGSSIVNTEPSTTVTFVGIESVTVPAGTFSAYKFQYVQTSQGSQAGTSSTSTSTTWYDTSSTSTRIVKSTTLTTVSGYTPAPTGQKSFDMELASYH